MFGSILTFGGLIGAIFSGKVADVLGRKRMMLFCEAFCVTGWLVIALAKDALWLDCGRLLLGIGVGLFSYVIPVYIAEIAPKHVRGSFVFANQLMQNCGIALFFIIGNLVPWRLLAIVGFVPCVLHVFCLFFIPESPRWLAKKGRDEDCRSALQRLRGPDVDISCEANTIRDTLEMSEIDGGSRMAELFQRRYAYPLLIGVGLMFLQQLSGSSGVTYYASSLFQKGGFPSAIGTSVIATIMVPKAMLGTIIVDKLGRRTLLMTSCAAMGLSALLLSVSYGLQSFGILPYLTPIFTCIGVLGHIVTFAMGMGGLPWIIMAEVTGSTPFIFNTMSMLCFNPETLSFSPVTTSSTVVNRPSTPTFLRREAAGDSLGSVSTLVAIYVEKQRNVLFSNLKVSGHVSQTKTNVPKQQSPLYLELLEPKTLNSP
ncbi:sugar transporter ERD6-like isoform X5 [Raphanus sativus]|nr:sugar transporter ERD6-like isoform X5 [Raphanus sativus]